MPFINGFFYPDEVKIGQPPDLGGMIAKAMAMRQARQQAQMQQERDKMGMELDRMKLAGAIESQKKEKAKATALGDIVKAYTASQNMPDMSQKMPNLGAMFGGMGGMNVPGMIPTTVAGPGPMSLEDTQKQMFLKVAEMGDSKDQMDAIQALVPIQRGRSAEDQIMIDDNRFKQRLVEQKNKLDAATATLQETFRFKDRSREDAQAHAASIANLQAQNTTYNNMLRLAQQREMEPLVEEIGADGKMYLRRRSDANYNLAGVGGGIPQPGGQQFNPPAAPRANVGAPPSNASTFTPDQAMTDDVVGLKVGGDPNATVNPPAAMQGFDKNGNMTGVVDTTIPPVDQKPAINQPGQPFTPAPKTGDNRIVNQIQNKYENAIKLFAGTEPKFATIYPVLDRLINGEKMTSTTLEQVMILRASVLDPASVVRESEVLRYQEFRPLKDKAAELISRINNAMTWTPAEAKSVKEDLQAFQRNMRQFMQDEYKFAQKKAEQVGGQIIERVSTLSPDNIPGGKPIQATPEWAKGWRSGTKNGVRIFQNPASKKILDADGNEVK